MAITVAIIESRPELRRELKDMVALDANCSCVCVGANWQAELGRISQLAPDVVVLDVSLPEGEDLEGIARIKRELPQTQILITSACEENEQIFKALRAGANGYLLKRTASRELLRAIRNLSVTSRPSPCPSR